MKVTVRDCMKLPAFASCSLVAGARNIDNKVRSVSVMDATNLDTAIKKNGIKDQLVLTSFYGMSGNIALQKEVILSLKKYSVSGLVVFHTKPLTDEDKAIIKLSEEVGLPFILISSDNITYSDAIEQVMDRLLYRDNFRNDLINKTVYHLLNFEKYNNFPAALKEAAISNQLQIVMLSKDFNPILVVETRHLATISDAVKLMKEQNNISKGVYSMVDVEGVVTYWGKIAINKSDYFLLIVDNEDSYSAGEITKFAEIIELAMGMWKYTPERDMKAELIQSLIRGNKSLAYSLKDEMGIDAADIVSVFLAKGIDNAKGHEVILNFEKEHDFEVLCIRENAEIYGIVLKKKKIEDSQQLKHWCLQLYTNLKEIGKSVRIFHSTGIDGLEGAADGFKVIGETASFVEHVFPYKRVFTKYELVLVSSCINIQMQCGYLKKSYVQLLEPFHKEIGETKARHLLETLETFVLDAGMNSSKTAEFMGIHTNTVQYRLKRINDILGAEITGNRVIPALTMALALRRLENVCN